LFKVKEGDCIGGYNKEMFSDEKSHLYDNDAFLFNLSCYRHFPSKLNAGGIQNGLYYGPCFSAKDQVLNDLCAYNEFLGIKKCKSYSN
jgi:hypothetical protein